VRADVNSYEQIAHIMLQAAPRPHARLRGLFRVHGGMFQGRFLAVADDGSERRFELGARELFAVQKALNELSRDLATGKGPGFARADLELHPAGTFDLRVHDQARLASSLVEAVRRLWPQDARRLRLSATFDSHGRFQHRYEQIEADGRAHYLDWPMPPTGDFDDVTRVLADLWESRGDKFRELALELGESGDDHRLLLDGREP
jgi:hypothetical protein